MQKLAAFLLQKWWLTLLLIISFYYLPYFGWVSMILMALLALGQNIRISSLALLALLVPQCLTSLLIHQFTWLLLMSTLFLWASAIVLKRSQSWSEVFNLSVAVIVVLIPVIYWVSPQIQASWTAFWAWLMSALGQVVSSSSFGLSKSGINVPLWNEWLVLLNTVKTAKIDILLPKISTGLLVVGYILGDLGYLLLARGWAIKTESKKLSLAPELRLIRLHLAAALALVLTLVCENSWLAYRLDLLCALGGIFFIAGLSLVHWLAHRLGRAWIWLVLFYIALTLMPRSFSIVLVVLAFIDSIVNVRTRLKEVVHDGSHLT